MVHVTYQRKSSIFYDRNSKEEFHTEFEKMPWLAMDGDQEGTVLKHALATNLKAYNIPTLVILNLKTGNFVFVKIKRAAQLAC